MKEETVDLKATVCALLKWYSVNARHLPWRREPYRHDPYSVYVSEIMLQQTQVVTVIPYWQRWMRALPGIADLAKASPAALHKLWEGLGYYTRVRNMQRAARQVMSLHHGQFPRVYDDVLALPGVGRYTAGAICSIAFEQPTPVLDGNVIRVLARVFGIREDTGEKPTRERLWRLAADLVNQAAGEGTGGSSALNQGLMELGALVCLPRERAQCGKCPLRRLCAAHLQKLVTELPKLPARPAPTRRRFAAFVAERRGRFLVRQRPAGVVNAHLWEFPNVELAGRRGGLTTAAARALGATPLRVQWVGELKHTITRYRITVEIYRAELNGAEPSKARQARWLTPVQMRRLAFTSAHRKILGRVTD